MQEVFKKYAPLGDEVKRQLYNVDCSDEWFRKWKAFLCGLAVMPRNQLGGLPPELDAIWHAAILNTEQYALLCHDLQGRFIHHSTMSDSDSDLDKLDRRDRLVHAYRKRFREEPDDALWANDVTIPPPEGEYQIFVKMLDGRTRTMSIRATDTILKIKQQIYQWARIPICEQRLIYAGASLWNDKTLWDYALVRESTVHLVLSLKGC